MAAPGDGGRRHRWAGPPKGPALGRAVPPGTGCLPAPPPRPPLPSRTQGLARVSHGHTASSPRLGCTARGDGSRPGFASGPVEFCLNFRIPGGSRPAAHAHRHRGESSPARALRPLRGGPGSGSLGDERDGHPRPVLCSVQCPRLCRLDRVTGSARGNISIGEAAVFNSYLWP